MKKRYLVKLFSNTLNALINIVMVAIVPSTLGPAAYGQFVYLQQFFEKLTGFFDGGTSLAFFSKLSARPARHELISFYLLFAFLLLCVLLCITLGGQLLGAAQSLLPGIPEHYLLTAAGFAFLLWFTQVFIKISDAYALTVSVELIKSAHKIASLLLLLYFVYAVTFDLGTFFVYHYIALLSFLFIIGYLFYRKEIFTRHTLSLKLDFKQLVNEFVSFCSPLVLISILTILAGLFDIWLLQRLHGSEQMGFYGLAYQIAAMCFLFTSAMTPIITREFARSHAEADLTRMAALFKRYIPMLYAIAAFFGIFIAFQAENLLCIFTDEHFSGALWVVVVMAFYPLHQTYGQLSGSVFYATEQTRLYRNIGLFSIAIGLPLSVILIYLLDLGALGLAAKMVLLQFIGVNIQLYYNAKLLKLKMLDYVWHQVGTVVFFTLLAFAGTLLGKSISDHILSFVVSGALYTALVIIAAYIYPNIFSLTRNEINSTLKRVADVLKRKA